MRISLLNIEYNNELIITDVDDCLIKTTESILAHGLTKKDFWFNKDIYESNYISVFKESELTDWGIEFSDLIKKNQLTNYEIIKSTLNKKHTKQIQYPKKKIIIGFYRRFKQKHS